MAYDIIDIHSHLYFENYDTDRDLVIAKMKSEGVATISIGTVLETSVQAVDLADKNENMFACIGIHPVHAHEVVNIHQEIAHLRMLGENPKVVAVGECGLDYFHLENPEHKAIQVEVFKQQIHLAQALHVPLMIHCREAYDDVLALLAEYNVGTNAVHVHFHFFAGNDINLKEILDRGYTLSFTGVITFTDAYTEAIKAIPLDRLMIETDAPFVAPVPWRGKRSDPTMVRKVADKIAEIKGISTEELLGIVNQNSMKIFSKIPQGFLKTKS